VLFEILLGLLTPASQASEGGSRLYDRARQEHQGSKEQLDHALKERHLRLNELYSVLVADQSTPEQAKQAEQNLFEANSKISALIDQGHQRLMNLAKSLEFSPDGSFHDRPADDDDALDDEEDAADTKTTPIPKRPTPLLETEPEASAASPLALPEARGRKARGAAEPEETEPETASASGSTDPEGSRQLRFKGAKKPEKKQDARQKQPASQP
jgi:hypothetical protein